MRYALKQALNRAILPKKVTSTGELLHSEWNQRLGACSLLAIGCIVALTLGLHVELPKFLSLSSATSIRVTNDQKFLSIGSAIFSVMIAFAIVYLAGQQLSWIAGQLPKSCLLYRFTYTYHSEVLAFMVGWSQFFDYASLIAVIASITSEHMDLLFYGNLQKHLRMRLWSETKELPFTPSERAEASHIYIDVVSLASICLAGFSLFFSIRVLATVTIVFLLFTALTTVSTVIVAFMHNVGHLSLFTLRDVGFDEVITGSACLLPGFFAIECTSFMAEEMKVRRRRIVPGCLAYIRRFHFVTLAVTLIAILPFTQRLEKFQLTSLPAMFGAMRIFSAQYLMNCGSICALLATLLCLFLPPTRILTNMGKDQLLPGGSVLRSIGKAGSPRVAVLVTMVLAAIINITVPRSTLMRILPLSLSLRLLCKAFLVYTESSRPLAQCDELDDEEPMAALVANYQKLKSAQGDSSLTNSVSNSSSLSGASSDFDIHEVLGKYGESLLVHQQLWKLLVTSDSRGFAAHDAITTVPLPPHNCLNSSCNSSCAFTVFGPHSLPSAAAQSAPHHVRSSNLAYQCVHLYETDTADSSIKRQVRVVKNSGDKSTGSGEVENVRLKAARLYACFLTASMLIALMYKILRETNEYTPILPLISLVVSSLLAIELLLQSLHLKFWIRGSRGTETKRNGKIERVRCLLGSFLIIQLLPQFPVWCFGAILVLYTIGFLTYLCTSILHRRAQ